MSSLHPLLWRPRAEAREGRPALSHQVLEDHSLRDKAAPAVTGSSFSRTRGSEMPAGILPPTGWSHLSTCCAPTCFVSGSWLPPSSSPGGREGASGRWRCTLLPQGLVLPTWVLKGLCVWSPRQRPPAWYHPRVFGSFWFARSWRACGSLRGSVIPKGNHGGQTSGLGR